MIVQKIMGGLGNQMFQYAYIKALSLRNNIPFLLDINGYKNYALHGYGLEKFTIQKSYAEDYQIPWYMQWQGKKHHLILQSILKKINRNHYQEKHFHFDKDMLDITKGYVEGYFQSEKYFADFADDIRKDFQFSSMPSDKNENMTQMISACNAISLHIRRGDYVTNPTNSFYNVCDLGYYKRAIAYINNVITDPTFFIFSDDIERVKKNLVIDSAHHYIGRNNADTNHEDMRLMSLCKHNIIANSSFSWRGAWLNNNPDKIVIGPKKRFATEKLNYKDVIPTSRVKI